jgi:hypothetical protein
MATKEHKRQARQAIEGLELRIHRGPPIQGIELQVLRNFLWQNDFSPASDYYSRLRQIQEELHGRAQTATLPAAKRNYGGESAGRYLQVQSVFDHVIVSTCYEGEFNTKRGRIKLSHRFNQAGRIDFVELKFLRALHPSLGGEIRKLLLVQDYRSLPKNWLEAEAFVLPILPQELIFLYPDLFRCPRTELLAWLVNIGHGIASDLVEDLAPRVVACPSAAGSVKLSSALPNHSEVAGNELREPIPSAIKQGPLAGIVQDWIAWPILNKSAELTSAVGIISPETVKLQYSMSFR